MYLSKYLKRLTGSHVDICILGICLPDCRKSKLPNEAGPRGEKEVIAERVAREILFFMKVKSCTNGEL